MDWWNVEYVEYRLSFPRRWNQVLSTNEFLKMKFFQDVNLTIGVPKIIATTINIFFSYLSQTSFMRLNVFTYVTSDIIVLLSLAPSLLLCIYYFSGECVAGKKCHFALRFSESGEGNFAEKLNQFPRLISHTRPRLSTIHAASHAYTIRGDLRGTI